MKRLLKNRKLLASGAVVAVLLAMAFWPKTVAVDLAPVVRGPLTVTVDEEGETRVHERFVVSAPVAGRVLRVELEPGDAVERGRTVLATFLPAEPSPLDARSRAEAEAGVKAAEAGLGQARAQRDQAAAAEKLAGSDLARSRALAAEKIVSPEALESAVSQARTAEEALRAAEFGVGVAEHDLAMARARLLSASGGGGTGREPLVIRSPIDGVVLKRVQESEAVLAAGSPLLELGDPRRLEIVADFLSTDAVKIHPGDAVQIERWGGDTVVRGRVRRVEPSGFLKISALGVEEQRVNVIIDFEDPYEAWKRLGDGYRVEVRVVVWEGQDVLKVPTSCLFRRGESWAVFAVDAGRARLRAVGIGQRNGTEAQVLAGLAGGQSVIVHPSDAIDDGTRAAGRRQ